MPTVRLNRSYYAGCKGRPVFIAIDVENVASHRTPRIIVLFDNKEVGSDVYTYNETQKVIAITLLNSTFNGEGSIQVNTGLDSVSANFVLNITGAETIVS